MADADTQPTSGKHQRRRLRPGRVITLVIVFLLLGAIVNIAVAWTCALVVNPTEGDDPVIGLSATELEVWEISRNDRFGVTWVRSSRTFGQPPIFSGIPVFKQLSKPLDEVTPSWGDVSDPTPQLVQAARLKPDAEWVRERRNIFACGWPLRSLWCQVDSNIVTSEEVISVHRLSGGIGTGLSDWGGYDFFPRVLPMRPISFGFMVNTIAFAVVTAMPYVALFPLRRHIRKRRGQCPQCGYPMGQSPRCTECGNPLPGRAEAV